MKAASFFSFFLAIIAFFACSEQGKRLEFNGGEMFYKKPVSHEQATRLGEYLTESGFFDGKHKTLELSLNDSVFELCMVVEPSQIDSGFIELVSEFAVELSEEVFQSFPVDIHLCNKKLKPIKIIPFSYAGQESNSFDLKEMSMENFYGGEIYYTKKIKKKQVEKLGSFLIQDEFFDGSTKSVLLDRKDKEYHFHMVVLDGYVEDSEFLTITKMYSKHLSDHAFSGAPVHIHLCDNRMNTLKIIPFEKKPSKQEDN